MIQDQIQGHLTQISQLNEAIDRNHLPHALLFVGPESIGKQKVAWALAQRLLCENNIENLKPQACGLCPSCMRVTKQQSENVMLIKPDGQNIKIDQAREIIQFLSLGNFGRNRIIIIDQAHFMNPQAANAILKILEEPAEQVYFILIAPEAEAVMSTIRSRSQVIRFSALSIDELKSLKPGLSEWIYKCSRGQLAAVSSLSDEDGTSKRLQSFELLEAFWTDAEFLMKQGHPWRTAVKDREEAQSLVKSWILIMRDVLVFKMGQSDKILNIDQIEKIKTLAFLENSKINAFVSQLFKIEKEIQGYMDSILLIESLWVQHARLD